MFKHKNKAVARNAVVDFYNNIASLVFEFVRYVELIGDFGCFKVQPFPETVRQRRLRPLLNRRILSALANTPPVPLNRHDQI